MEAFLQRDNKERNIELSYSVFRYRCNNDTPTIFFFRFRYCIPTTVFTVYSVRYGFGIHHATTAHCPLVEIRRIGRVFYL